MNNKNNGRKKIYFILITISLLLISCASTPKLEAIDETTQQLVSFKNTTWACEEEGQILKFNKDGTFDYTDRKIEARGKYVADGSELIITNMTYIGKKGFNSWNGDLELQWIFFLKDGKLLAYPIKKIESSDSSFVVQQERFLWLNSTDDDSLCGVARRRFKYTFFSDSTYEFYYGEDYVYNVSDSKTKHLTSKGKWTRRGDILITDENREFLIEDKYILPQNSTYFFVKQ